MEEQVATATPAERLLMLFDRLRLDMEMARASKEAGDHEGSNARFLSAQGILVVLATTLDRSWEGAERLDALYRYCWEGLVAANVAGDMDRLDEVEGILGQLHAAWQVAAATPVAAAG